MISTSQTAAGATIPIEPTPACDALTASDEVVCRCLDVSASAIRAAAAVDGCRTVRDIIGATEAGGGCTACHRRITELLSS